MCRQRQQVNGGGGGYISISKISYYCFIKATLPGVGGMKERRGKHSHGKEKLVSKEMRCDWQTEAKTERKSCCCVLLFLSII